MNHITHGEEEKTVIGTFDPGGAEEGPGVSAGEATQMSASIQCPVCGTPNPPSEIYCSDCGFLLSAEPAAVITSAADAGRLVTSDSLREFALGAGENLIGRENADVLLSHNTVSRAHARIIVTDDAAVIEDLGSKNGTFVDGRRLTEGAIAPLADACEITIGSVVLHYCSPAAPDDAAVDGADPEQEPLPTEAQIEYEDGEPEDQAAAPEPETEALQEDEAAPPVVARLVSPDRTACFDLLDGLNTIGRRQDENTIAITDPYASGRHADVSVQDGAILIRDVGSTNGTFVNGTKLEPDSPLEVSPGDEITIGQSIFILEEA